MRNSREAAAPPSPVPMSTELNEPLESYMPASELSEPMPVYEVFDVAIETYDYELFRETLQTFSGHSNFEHLTGLAHYIKQKKEGTNFRGSFFFRALCEAITLIHHGETEELTCDQVIEKYNKAIVNTGNENLDKALTLTPNQIYMMSTDGKAVDPNLVKKVFLTKIFSIIINEINPSILSYRFFWDLYNDPNFLDDFAKKTFLDLAKSSQYSDLFTSAKSPTEIAFERNQVDFLREHYPHKKYYAWLIELKKSNPAALNISTKLDEFLHDIGVIDKDEIKSDAYYQKRNKMHGADGEENYKRLMSKLESMPKNQETSDALLKEFNFNHAFSSNDEESIITHGLMSPKEAIEKGFKGKTTTPEITVNSTVFGYAFNDPPLHKGNQCNRVLNIPTDLLDSKHSWTSHHVVEYENQIEGNSYKFYGKKAGCFTTMDLRFKTHDSQRVLMISLHYSFIDGSSDIVTRTKTVNKPFNDEVYAGDLSKIMLGVFYERASLLKHEDDPSKNSPLERILEEPHYAITAANFLMTRRTFELHYDQTINVKQSGITITDNPAFNIMAWHSACTRAIAAANATQFEKLIRETPNPFIYTSIFNRQNFLTRLFSQTILMHTSHTLTGGKEESKALEEIICKILTVGFHQDNSPTPKVATTPFLLTRLWTDQIENIVYMKVLEEILSLDIYSENLKEIIISHIDEHARLIPQSACNYLLLFFDETSSRILYQSEKKFCTFKEITNDMRKKIEAPLTDDVQKNFPKRAIALHKTLKNQPVEISGDAPEIQSMADLYMVAKNKIPLERCKKGTQFNPLAACVILFLQKYDIKMNKILDFLGMDNLKHVSHILSSIFRVIVDPNLIDEFESLNQHMLAFIQKQLDNNLLDNMSKISEFHLFIYAALRTLNHDTFAAIIKLIKEKAIFTTGARGCIEPLLGDNMRICNPENFPKNIELYLEHTIATKTPPTAEEIVTMKSKIDVVAAKILENTIVPNSAASHAILEILRLEERKGLKHVSEIAQPLQEFSLLQKLKAKTVNNNFTPIDTAYASAIFRKIVFKAYLKPDSLVLDLTNNNYNTNDSSFEAAYYHCKNYTKFFNGDLTENPLTQILLRLFDGTLKESHSIPEPPSETKAPLQQLHTKLYHTLHMTNALVNKDEKSVAILKNSSDQYHVNYAICIAFPIARKFHEIGHDDISFLLSGLLPNKINVEGQNPFYLLQKIFLSIKNTLDYIKLNDDHLNLLSEIISPEKLHTKTQILQIIRSLKLKSEDQINTLMLLEKMHPKNLTENVTPTGRYFERTNMLSALLYIAIEDSRIDDNSNLVLGEKSQCIYNLLKTPLIQNYLQKNTSEVLLSIRFFLKELVDRGFDQGRKLTGILVHFLGCFNITLETLKKLVFKNDNFFDLEFSIKDHVKEVQSIEKNKSANLLNINYFYIDTDEKLIYKRNICVLTLFYLLGLKDKFETYLKFADKMKKITMSAISNLLDHVTLPLSDNQKIMLKLIPEAFQGKKVFNKRFGTKGYGLLDFIASKVSEMKQELVNLYYPSILSDQHLKSKDYPDWLNRCIKSVPDDLKKQYSKPTGSKKRGSRKSMSQSKKARVQDTTSEKSFDESDAASSSAGPGDDKSPKREIASPATASAAKRSRSSAALFQTNGDGAAAAAAAAASSSSTAMKTGK